MLTETLDKTEKASLLETEKAISFIKKIFESKLRSYLDLTKVSCGYVSTTAAAYWRSACKCLA